MTEITIQAEQKAPAVHSPRDMVAVIAKIASDPNTDVSKMEKLLEIQMKMMATQAKIDFDSDFALMQAKMPRIPKSGFNGGSKSKYMTLEDIDNKVRSLMGEYGFSVSYSTREETNKMFFTATLRHKGGHYEVSNITLPYDGVNNAKNAIQAHVSTVKYGKRACLGMLLNLVAEGEDDDGQRASPMLSQEQINEIKDLLLRTGTTEEKFCQLVKVDKIENLHPARFDGIINSLNKKLASMA